MFWVILTMALIAAYQVPPMLRQKEWQALTAFVLVWLAGTIYALLAVARVPLPTVVEIITFINEILPFLPLN